MATNLLTGRTEIVALVDRKLGDVLMEPGMLGSDAGVVRDR
jgi:hypothetical protein